MKEFFKNNNKGFTLVEALVAISIFTVSILGLLSVLSQGIADTSYAKQKVVATYLAEEGIEYIRNMRDTFVLFDPDGHDDGWGEFKTKLLSASCDAGEGCYFDDSELDYTESGQPMTQIAVDSCNGSCPPILYTTGRYSITNGPPSGYTRKIQLEEISDQEVKVTSTVYWTQGSGDYNISFSENLYNWQP